MEDAPHACSRSCPPPCRHGRRAVFGHAQSRWCLSRSAGPTARLRTRRRGARAGPALHALPRSHAAFPSARITRSRASTQGSPEAAMRADLKLRSDQAEISTATASIGAGPAARRAGHGEVTGYARSVEFGRDRASAWRAAAGRALRRQVRGRAVNPAARTGRQRDRACPQAARSPPRRGDRQDPPNARGTTNRWMRALRGIRARSRQRVASRGGQQPSYFGRTSDSRSSFT
jgi:hypothetical protein